MKQGMSLLALAVLSAFVYRGYNFRNVSPIYVVLFTSNAFAAAITSCLAIFVVSSSQPLVESARCPGKMAMLVVPIVSMVVGVMNWKSAPWDPTYAAFPYGVLLQFFLQYSSPTTNGMAVFTVFLTMRILEQWAPSRDWLGRASIVMAIYWILLALVAAFGLRLRFLVY